MLTKYKFNNNQVTSYLQVTYLQKGNHCYFNGNLLVFS